MEAVITYLKTLPKDVLTIVIYELMKSGKLSYHDITQLHIQKLERLQKAESDAYWDLQMKVTPLFTDYKRNIPKHIKNIMQHLKDKGTINITQERIDNYKV